MKKFLAGIVSAALVLSIVPGFSLMAKTAQKAAAAPTSSAPSDYCSSAFKVTLKSATPGAKIYYTTNKKTPTVSSSKYVKALSISKTTTLKAIAVKSGLKNSTVSTFTYDFSKLTGNITADGSSALQPLLLKATPKFKSKYSNFTGSISIQAGGSGTGLTDVSNGTVKIGDSDVTPNQIGSSAAGLIDHKVCVVAVGLAVSSNVYSHLKDISSSQLKGIFNGSITNWKQIKGWKGGSLPIQVYYRKSNSGTRCLFEDYGSGVKFTDAKIATFQNFTKKESSGDLETAISRQSSSAGAIGYETLPYCTNLKLLKFNGVAANYSNVYTGKYKIWGYEHMYTKGSPDASAQAFINYVGSKDFASTVISSGYGLTSSMKVSR